MRVYRSAHLRTLPCSPPASMHKMRLYQFAHVRTLPSITLHTCAHACTFVSTHQSAHLRICSLLISRPHDVLSRTSTYAPLTREQIAPACCRVGFRRHSTGTHEAYGQPFVSQWRVRVADERLCQHRAHHVPLGVSGWTHREKHTHAASLSATASRT